MEKKSTAQVHLQNSSYGALGHKTLMLSNHFKIYYNKYIKAYRLMSCWKIKVKTTFVCDKQYFIRMIAQL